MQFCSTYQALKQQMRNLYLAWLITCILLVLVTLVIGGLTRLEQAGLSIVEWRPITGIIPPLSEQDWHAEFAKYQTSPEFKLINNHISLSYFKYIYALEYIHRLAGRLVGLIFGIPYFYMLIARHITLKESKLLSVVLLLIGCQGLLGWLMVKSGLGDVPHVSHFRLAAHLVTALIIYAILVYLLLNILYPAHDQLGSNYHYFSFALIIFIFIQIFFGALTAGLHGGLIYNEFPYMGHSFIPTELTATYQHAGLPAVFSNAAAIQFIHRSLAYLLSLFIMFFYCYYSKINDKKLQISLKLLVFILTCQLCLGIAVILLVVPSYLALIHQLFAVFLLTCSLYIYVILKTIARSQIMIINTDK